MNDHFVSLIRTWVPIGAGFVLTMLARKFGIVIDEESTAGLVAGVTALAAAGYYWLARLIEAKLPWAGVFLGSRKQPEYTKAA